MKNQTLESIARFAHAKLSHEDQANLPVRSISIDTRTISKGDIYLPIIGEKWDGHNFIEEAFEKGAIASFIAKDHEIKTEGIYLVVDDTLETLQTCAHNYRMSLDIKVIAITGSNGKTTTKDVIYSLLKEKYKTKKTIGNLNNHIGVPRTLLDLDEDTEIALVEMGMDDFNYISKLVEIAVPDISIITNIGDVHLEKLKTKENIAKAKLEILQGMDEEGIFIYNYDDFVLRKEVKAMEIVPKVVNLGMDEEADHRLKLIKSNQEGTTFILDQEEYKTNLLGSYQMYNASIAILLAKYFGLTKEQIEKGLEVTDLTSMRAQLLNFNGFDLLVDCYKSNPQSLIEAFATANLLSGYRRKIAILGDMLELGKDEVKFHYDAGYSLDPNQFDYVLFYGPLSKHMMAGALNHYPSDRLFHFHDKADLVDKAKYLIVKNTLVLLKASRALRLEEVVENLMTITL